MTDDADNWDDHWATLSDSAADNPAQHFRHRLVTRLVQRAAPQVLLDLGSGQGDLLERIAADVPEAALVGVELSSVGVAHTRTKVPRATVRQVDLLAPGSEAALTGIGADVAVCCEVLEHLDHPDAFLRAAAAALAPGATLVVTVPGGPRSAFDRLIGHRRHYAPGDLRALLEGAGFVVERAYGAGFPFFNLYRLVVVARGDKLAADVSGARPGRLATVAMRVFDVLLRCSLPADRWGWQTVAVATWPAPHGPADDPATGP